MDEAPWTTAEHIWASLDKLKSEIDESNQREFYKARIISVGVWALVIGQEYTEQNNNAYNPPSSTSFEQPVYDHQYKASYYNFKNQLTFPYNCFAGPRISQIRT